MAGKKTVTLRTHIAQAPGRPATGRSATGAGSDVERDTCGLGLAPADEARPPRAGAAWPPRMALARTLWLCIWVRVMLITRNWHSTLGTLCSHYKSKVGYGSAKPEVWDRKYGQCPIRDGDRFDPIDLCTHIAPGAHGITEPVSDFNFSSRGRQFQSGRSGPLEAPRQKPSSA